MIIRSMSLDPELNSTIKLLAKQLNISKGEMMRACLSRGLAEIVSKLGENPSPEQMLQMKALLGGDMLTLEQRQEFEIQQNNNIDQVVESTKQCQ